MWLRWEHGNLITHFPEKVSFIALNHDDKLPTFLVKREVQFS